MCVNVAWTTGCTFDSADEALSAAASKTNEMAVAEGCGNVLWTAACSFADIAEAAKVAQAHLDSMDTSKLSCVSTAWTAVCTV